MKLICKYSFIHSLVILSLALEKKRMCLIHNVIDQDVLKTSFNIFRMQSDELHDLL